MMQGGDVPVGLGRMGQRGSQLSWGVGRMGFDCVGVQLA